MSTIESILSRQGEQFEQLYQWVLGNMPSALLQEIQEEQRVQIAQALCLFEAQERFIPIQIPQGVLILCTPEVSSDKKILERYEGVLLKNYRSFLSKASLPLKDASFLKICLLTFSSFQQPPLTHDDPLASHVNALFMRSFSPDALSFFFRLFKDSLQEDRCQYHVQEENGITSFFLAWKGIPQDLFFHRFILMLFYRRIEILEINALHTEVFNSPSIILIHLRAKIPDTSSLEELLQELFMLPFFDNMPLIDTTYLHSGLLSGNLTILIKALGYFLYQTLSPFDSIGHSLASTEEHLCHYPSLLCLLLQAFSYKFQPGVVQLFHYQEAINRFIETVQQMSTGNATYDKQCQTTLLQAASFIEACAKTNFYVRDKDALCFRLLPKKYFSSLSYPYLEKFPCIPFALFFIKGLHFFGFHIRFADLARGGVRTVIPRSYESILVDKGSIFLECYFLAYTQQKKNKDIPEGGAKGVIFLEKPQDFFVLQTGKTASALPMELEERQRKTLAAEKQKESLYRSQRSYIKALLSLINCKEDGSLREEGIVDYWKQEEYLYLGPDENMHDIMIDWIANYSFHQAYKPGKAFISSKPGLGMNHKEFGVTSYGVNVYMQELLDFLKIDPLTTPFTVKMTGGSDGDVAGNQMLNLLRFYPRTAKLLTTIDISGTIFDPEGLDLMELQKLFSQNRPIADYPVAKLSAGGFLLDTRTEQETGPHSNKVLCTRNVRGNLTEEWIAPHEAGHLLHYTVHKTKADLFIPAGGRPKTLHKTNYKDFLDEEGLPSSKGIIEGANLYLTQEARRSLEQLGVLIIKDSSANKGGVICSSFEVLCNLCLSEEEFLALKPFLVEEVLDAIAKCSHNEARLLLQEHQQSNRFLTELSDAISEQILQYTEQILDLLSSTILSTDPKEPLNQVLLHYCLPSLRQHATERIMQQIPSSHKKAIIARHIASSIVYQKNSLSSPIPIQNMSDLNAKITEILT